MSESMLSRFFGVVARPDTWLNVLFHVLAFPLGLFYFVFLVTGLSVGVGLVVVWVGIPILLVVAGAWWLFAAFERVQAQYLLKAEVSPAPRSWEAVDGVWAKIKAHFGNGSTWKDLVYLLAKLVFGVVSFSLLVTLASIVAWLAAFPVASASHVHLITWGAGEGWTPPVWLAILAIPAAVLFFVLSLHIINAWGWVCARWAEVMLGRVALPRTTVAAPVPLVSTSPSAPAGAPYPPAYPQPGAYPPPPPPPAPAPAAPAPPAPMAPAPPAPYIPPASMAAPSPSGTQAVPPAEEPQPTDGAAHAMPAEDPTLAGPRPEQARPETDAPGDINDSTD